MSSTMMHYPLTLVHVLERVALLFGGREVITREPDGSVTRSTYAEIYDRARRLASALSDMGIAPGDRVATLSWNHRHHVEAYFGVPAAGAVLHTINPRLHPDDLEHIVRTAADRAVIVDDSLLPLVMALPDDVRPPHVLVVGEAPTDIAGVRSLDAVLDAVTEIAPYPEIHEDDAAAMCFTSATTGRPKGVEYSHRALVLHSIVSAMPDQFCVSGHDVVMPVVPMFHVNAWGLPYTAALTGASLVLPGPRLDGASILDLLVSERVTLTAGVPTVWTRVLDTVRQAESPPDLSSLRTVLIGGSAAAPALIEQIDALGPRVLHAWGMTETTPLGSVSRIKPGLEVDAVAALRLRAMQGIAAPLVDMRAMGSDAEVPRDGVSAGELQVRGPWITGRYVDGVAADRFTDDGWFCTGDIVTIDAAGYLRIVDRAGDLIKSGGEWISSLDLEAALLDHDAVEQAAVVALPDEVWSERPVAMVVLREPVATDELRDLLLSKFAKWQVPNRILVLDELPMTATGKISKLRLRERLALELEKGPLS